ncbi:MAG: adenosylmethionine decarboxylase [Bdellovibrionales bacterium]|nr:adenosylmethionine decarboxylase [Bdellovibrionales bacterium]
MKKVALGRHLLLEFSGCDRELINSLDHVRECMLESAKLSNAQIVTDVFHRFNPHGLSGVVVIAESHIAIHTWPEHGCASVDVFSCGAAMKPERIEAFLKEKFKAEHSAGREFERGVTA